MTSFRWLLLCSILACDSEPVGPGGPILRGQWGAGGEDPAQLIGLGVAAELRLACSSVSIHTPVELAQDGAFGFTGKYQSSMRQVGGPGTRAKVQGRLQGETVTLTFDILGDDLPGWSYTLQRGVDPHFEDLPPMCPQ